MLKKVFRSKGVKQIWIAEKLGVSEVTVSNWVNNKTKPTQTHLKKLAELLDIPMARLNEYYGTNNA